MFRSKLLHIPARLACVRHAASVRPEPGSNSCVKSCIEPRSIASSSKLNYELTVFVLTVTRENHSLAFVFFILYRFQGSSRQPRVALALTAQLLYRVIRRLSTPFSHFFSSFFHLRPGLTPVIHLMCPHSPMHMQKPALTEPAFFLLPAR